MTWGNPAYGGDSSQVVRVQRIQATQSPFAAILDDGSVASWGNPAYGGVSSRSAILDDGSVVTWGEPDWGTVGAGLAGSSN